MIDDETPLTCEDTWDDSWYEEPNDSLIGARNQQLCLDSHKSAPNQSGRIHGDLHNIGGIGLLPNVFPR